MADTINFFVDFKVHELYPKNREFTDYEAWLDLLIQGYPTGKIERTLNELASCWHWNKSAVYRFLERLEALKLLVRKDAWEINRPDRWYKQPEEVKESSLANAQRVLNEFNMIMGKKHEMNDYRARTIAARIKEGLKRKPPISIADFRMVFLYKKGEWESDKESAKWLTIETLCARKHFLKYLDQAQEAKRTENTSRLQGSILTTR